MDELDAIFDSAHGLSGPAPAGAGSMPSASMDLDAIFDSVHSNVAPPAAPSFTNEFLSVGNRAVDGIADLLGVAEAANRNLNPLQPGGPRMFGLNENAANAGSVNVPEQVRDAAQAVALYGPEKADTLAGRVLGQVAYNAPGVVVPGGTLPLRAASAVGAGLASGATREVTDSPIADLVASVLGGAAPGLASQVPNVFGAGRRALFGASDNEAATMAAQTMRDYTGLTADAVGEALARRPDDELGRLMTTAEVTQNAPMAQIEKTLSRDGLNAQLYSEAIKGRQTARNTILDAASASEAVNREGLGSALMSRAADVSDALGKEADSLWQAVPRRAVVPVDQYIDEVLQIVGRKQAGLPLDSKVRTLVDQFANVDDGLTRTSGQLQDIRSDALSLMRDAKLTATEEQALVALQKGIDDAMGAGLTGKDYDAWKAARQATANNAQTFKRGTAGGALTEDVARPSNVLSNALKGDTQSVRELRAAIANDPALIEDIKRGILDSIPRDAQGQLTANKMKGFLAANEGGLKELFGEDHYKAMRRILDDLRSETDTQGLAYRSSKGNSITAQANTVAAMLSDAMEQNVAPSGILGTLWSQVRGNAKEKTASRVRKLLFEAAMDPEVAQQLLGKPTVSQVDSVARALLNQAGVGAQQAVRNSLAPFGSAMQAGEGEVAPLSQPTPPVLLSEDKPPSLNATPVPTQNQGNIAKLLGAALSIPTAAAQTDMPTIESSEIPRLIQAVIKVESSGNPEAVSHKGAQGLMQVMPATARDIAKELGIEKYDLKDPETNKLFGSFYLKKMLDMFDGDVELALTAYNQGPARVRRLLDKTGGTTLADIIDQLGPDGRAYAKKVLSRFDKQVTA